MSDLSQQAVNEIQRHVAQHGPKDPHVCPGPQETRWDSDLLRTLSRHRLSVLGQAADICVFFDQDGGFLGFRDDAILGAEYPVQITPEAFLAWVGGQLDLPPEARLGRCESVRLPHVGWCYEGVVMLKDLPAPQDILTVWLNSQTGQVIQCLYRNGPGAPIV